MPRRIAIYEFGGPENLRIEEFSSRPLQPGELRLRVEAMGVNRADILIREGSYHSKKLPIVPGFDASGCVIESSGEIGIGSRVLIIPGSRGLGFYSEEVIVSASDVLVLSDNISYSVAASIPVNWLTAQESLFRRAGLKRGETLVVLAGSSGVGQAAIQLAQAQGVRVIATVSRQVKADYLKDTYGCDVLVAGAEDLPSQVLEMTCGSGADVVFDLIGGDFFRPALQIASNGGRVVQAANVTLRDSLINVRDFYAKNLSIFGFQYGNATTIGLEHYRTDLPKILEGFAKGLYRSTISKIFSMDKVATAHETLVDRSHYGKIVLLPQAGVH